MTPRSFWVASSRYCARCDPPGHAAAAVAARARGSDAGESVLASGERRPSLMPDLRAPAPRAAFPLRGARRRGPRRSREPGRRGRRANTEAAPRPSPADAGPGRQLVESSSSPSPVRAETMIGLGDGAAQPTQRQRVCGISLVDHEQLGDLGRRRSRRKPRAPPRSAIRGPESEPSITCMTRSACGDLFQRGTEGVDELVRQMAYEANRVGQGDGPPIGQNAAAHRGIQGGEQRVFHQARRHP